MLTVELLVRRPDVYFQTGHATGPLFYNARTVITLFDVAYLMAEFEAYFSADGLKLLIADSARGVAHASHIVTISENSKRDITRLYGVPASQITVAYPGVDREFFSRRSAEEVARVRMELGLEKPYIVHVGSLQPRKNLGLLMDALRVLKGKGRLNHQLVLAGMSGWLEGPIFQAVRDLRLVDDVVFLGMVPAVQLPALMCGADVLALPSLYEGFGLPLVEAMSCGVPIIASDISSIPEVVGAAGILVPPGDVDGWADALDDVLQHPERGRALVREGFVQVEKFSWSRAAAEVLAVLEEVGCGKSAADPGSSI
jgi:glycosyltransferase involved in cell wall biosynthesis